MDKKYSGYRHDFFPEKSVKSTSKQALDNAQVFSEFRPAHYRKPKAKAVLTIDDLEAKKFKHPSENIVEIVDRSDVAKEFIGLDTFENANVFSDLLDRELLFVKLNSSSLKENNSLCFKGKCSIGLVYGSVQINGYLVKNSYEEANAFRWHELYSPETNSYLSVKNQNANETVNNDMNNKDQFGNFLLDRIKFYLNIVIDQAVEEKLQNFLCQDENFNFQTGSLVVIHTLKSQMCNYLSYFENFKNVYQSLHDNKSELKKTNNQIDEKISKIGLYPVSRSHFDHIRLDNNEEISVIREIINPSNLNEENQQNISLKNHCPIIMTCGGKDVGKSTFLRYLINQLLNNYPKIAYVDCDPGQCEFTLGGCITISYVTQPIFGPPHTHVDHSGSNKNCYFLGHLSPNDVPSLYLEYLKKCLNDFQMSSKTEKIPLVINTMGWNQGLGLCLLKETILMYKPTHLIQINHPVEANKNMPLLDKNWLKASNGWPPNPNRWQLGSSNAAAQRSESEEQMDTDSCDDINYKLFILKSYVPSKANKSNRVEFKKNFSARDHRNIAIIAYFSRLHDSNSFKSIHNLRPYRISWSKIAIHVTHMVVDLNQLFHVLNASLVGLCQIDEKHIQRKQINSEVLNVVHTNIPDFKNIALKCFGFGIIRGINMESKEFYVLTPEPIQVLEQVNLLTKGMLNLPLEFFYEQDAETCCPYMSLSDTVKSENRSAANLIGGNPIQRKYLIHQNMQSSSQQTQIKTTIH